MKPPRKTFRLLLRGYMVSGLGRSIVLARHFSSSGFPGAGADERVDVGRALSLLQMKMSSKKHINVHYGSTFN